MKRYKYLLLLPLLLSACRDDSMRLDTSLDGNSMEVRLHAEIDQLNLTRADDSGFADGDVIGVFAVDFSNGQPGQLMATGNNADNVAFTFDEHSFRWNGTQAILFSDDKTPMNLYGYYPYSKSVDNIEAYPISVEYNQNGDSKSRNMSAYESSDFLWAKSAGLTSSDPSATLYFKHILASVRVTLVEGEGFEEAEWSALDKSVLVCSTSRDAIVNLSTGDVHASSQKDGRSILAKNYGDDYRAVVIPQSVEANMPLLILTVGTRSYTFKKDVNMTFLPTKQHNFTMQVNKNSANGDYEFCLVDESITVWESDLSSHNGAAKEYVVIEIPEEGLLASVVEDMKLVPEEIINMKIIGKMRNDDFDYIRSSLKNLEAINLREADLSESTTNSEFTQSYEDEHYSIPMYAFVGMSTLKSCVLPKKLKCIGAFAFYGTSLAGSLQIPEGVVAIERFAFSNFYSEGSGYSEIPGWQMINHNNLSGELVLPSSLRFIGGDAFRGCEFSGNLILPEGIEVIGSAAFSNCKYFTGDLRLPESLKQIGNEAFARMSGLSGWISLPSNLSELSEELFSSTPINNIEWPENLRSIGCSAFSRCEFKGDLRIPETVIDIGSHCFWNSNIKHLKFPTNITIIRSSLFRDCKELIDTVTIPSKVEIIEGSAFEGCERISAIVLPKALQRIDGQAFAGCYNIQYMRCDAVEPPLIDESAFWGIEKDNFTLEVPEQSVDAYRTAPGWCEFKRISAYRNFIARPSKYNVLNKGGVKDFVLNADADWEMIDCPEWCHVDKKSGSKKTTITVKVDQLVKGAQVRNGTITFRLKDSEEHLTHINVGQYDYEYDEDQNILLHKATKGQGINLVFLGDGYDAVDISMGSYLEDMKQEMEYLFGVEPYTTYRDYFNVYTVFALSEDSGVETLNTWRNTKFHVQIGDGCSKDGQRLSAAWIDALNYCAETIPQTVQGTNPKIGCILVGNSDIYEGVTYLGDSFCAVVTKSTSDYPYDARGLVQHEAGGHGIGWLADEYMYHHAFINNCKCKCCGHVDDLKADHSFGFALNVSLTGKYKDVPWTHLVFNKNYGDIVDVYEGGYFHTRGVYRSENNSCMNNNVPYFSTWSRQLIVQRIMNLAGETFDLNSFYAKDSRATGRDFTSTSRSAGSTEVGSSVRHGNPPIRITGYKYGKKGGRK